MKVRRPFNFVLGIICGFAMMLNLVRCVDIFTLVMSTTSLYIATVVNLIIGLLEGEDE